MVRVVTAGLGVVHGAWGLWASVFPRHFFDTFPGFGRRWTAAYPPYNEHLVADLGATFLTLAFLLGAAAATRSRGVRRVGLAAVVLFSALHLAFHTLRHGELDPADLATSLVALALGVVIPVALLLAEQAAARPGGEAA